MSEYQLRPSPGGGGVDAEAERGRRHAPVMAEEAIRFLRLRPEGFYVDGTLGDGGHSQRMLEADASLTVLGIDRDELSLQLTARRLADFGSRFQTYHGNFSELGAALAAAARTGADGILLDLGLSSRQLDDPGARLRLSRRRTARHADARRASGRRPRIWSRRSTSASSPTSSGATARSRRRGGSRAPS